jgi:SAM-dependent methyltransferase
MDDSATGTAAAQPSDELPPQRVLNVGCGAYSPRGLHPAFRNASWKEVRLDIDPNVKPDLVGSITGMEAVLDADFDAIWSSHNLEHLHSHEIARAVAEFRRVLKPDGFALITCPDLEAVAELVVSGRAEDAAYQSPAGPITALDMLYGHSASIEQGNPFMAHNTGFTADRLGRLLVDGGFAEALVIQGSCFDLWALALMPNANKAELLIRLETHRLNFFSDG